MLCVKKFWRESIDKSEEGYRLHKRAVLSKVKEKRALGDKLKAQYAKWTKTLNLRDFLTFDETIQKNKAEIGVAQFFGKFRAYAFEEYICRLLQAKTHIPKPLQLFWGEKCLVWRKCEKEYAVEFDVSIGERTTHFISPVMVFDAKVELDSTRLKTALASFAILKNWNREVTCILVYVAEELDSALLELARHWMDGIFQISLENDETASFLDYVIKCLG